MTWGGQPLTDALVHSLRPRKQKVPPKVESNMFAQTIEACLDANYKLHEIPLLDRETVILAMARKRILDRLALARAYWHARQQER